MRISDWSSDVCSSDLYALFFAFGCVAIAVLLNLYRLLAGPTRADRILALDTMVINAIAVIVLFGIYETSTTYFEARSEERRVGKECVSTCRSRWSPYH